ncbi:MAG: HEAT repeat domain-containing protein [Acidobacteria bacterium]|nr:HEAT repeat domain-containing protein [Acidobacteriota bacterium]
MKIFLAIITLSLTLALALPSAISANGNRRAAGKLSKRPAIEGLKISNERWPDASSLRAFGESAIRIQRARSEEEEALAVYDWIARVMTIGGSPYEGLPEHEVYVQDTLKILTVYGNHWCDGQARIYETVWRALGKQSRRLYIPMRHHTIVELLWRDSDGKERWHVLDVNNGWYVRNAQGWIANSEDIERDPLLVLAANQDLKMRTKGWLRTHLTPMPEHSMDIQLRRGESYSLLWDNGGVYYLNPKTIPTVPASSSLFKPGGDYERFIGGGEMIFAPDLSNPSWTDDLAAEPTNAKLLAGRITTAAANQPAVFTYQFDFPYVIADAVIEGAAFKSAANASAAISFSTDEGKTWTPAWKAADMNQSQVKLSLGIEREKSGQASVRGFYSYLLRFEMQGDPSQIAFSNLKFTHRTMMNRMTLPNLQPGWNRFKVAAQTMTADSALKLVVEWEDKEGLQRAERIADHLPFEFEVFANTSGGATVQMRALRFEAVALNEVAMHKSSPLERLKSGSKAERILAIIEAGASKQAAAVRPLIEILQGEDQELRYWAADALGKIGDPQAAPALIAAVRDPYEAVRMSASVALGDLQSKEAVQVLGELVSGKIPVGKGYALFAPNDVGAAQWMAAQALGRIGDVRAVPVLAATVVEAGGDLGLYIAKALGELGDRRAVPALIEAAKRGDEPALRGVVEALGKIGDASATPVLISLLETGKEDVRLEAAVALGRLHASSAVAALKKVSESDPRSYVREAAANALEAISKNQ